MIINKRKNTALGVFRTVLLRFSNLTFPIIKRKDEKQYRKDEKQYRKYRTKRVILETYDEIRRAIESREVYRTRLVPGPGDKAMAHKGR